LPSHLKALSSFQKEAALEKKKEAVKRLRATALTLDSTGVYPHSSR
jgi:hypothetical protein